MKLETVGYNSFNETLFYVRLRIGGNGYIINTIHEKLQIDTDDFTNNIAIIGGTYTYTYTSKYEEIFNSFSTIEQAQLFIDYLEPYLVMKKLTM
jgi:hypothetical protein